MIPFLPTPLGKRGKEYYFDVDGKVAHGYVEEPFTFSADDVTWRGVKDLVYSTDDGMVVHDHKSTSGLAWAKTADELREDVQSILYARHAFESADVVDLHWLYGTREEKPQVLPVRLHITFDEVADAMPPITRTAKRILKLYEEQPDPNSLPASLDMCEGFGGCEYQKICNRSLAERFKAIYVYYLLREKKKMGFRDRKVQQIDVKAEEIKEPETVNKPSMRERLGFGSAVTPPPFEKPEPAISSESSAAASAPEPEQIEVPKARRGRKPGSKNKPKEAAESNDSLRGSYEPAVMPDGFVLLVNTLPASGQPYTTLSEYLRPVLKTVQDANEVDYYGQIDYKSGAMLAAALYTHLEQNPPSGYLVVDKNTKEGTDCLPTLERFAREVLRGF